MSDYISREAALTAILGQPPDAHYPDWYAAQIRALPAADVIPVDWIINYATEIDKDGDVVFHKNHIDTMLERWREETGNE